MHNVLKKPASSPAKIDSVVPKAPPEKVIAPKKEQPSPALLDQKYVRFSHQKNLPPSPPVGKKEKKSFQKPTHPAEPSTHTFRWQNYFIQLPTLLLGLLGYLAIWFLFHYIEPSIVKDVFFPHLYLPLLFLCIWANFFSLWYVLQNVSHSLIISSFITSLLFLRLNHVFQLPIILLVGLPFLIVEILLTWKQRAG
jgi:hypothetical protein